MPRKRTARSFLRDNGLSLVLFALALAFTVGQVLAGWRASNEERLEHGQSGEALGEYVVSGHCLEALSENWESEFLQMLAFVYLTVFLFQRGSPESKDPDQEEDVDQDPRRTRPAPDAPWPVRRGGWALALYEHSLGLAFLLLFLLSFCLHGWSGLRHYNEEQALHGQPGSDLWGYLASARFWFESFQNWQSEFLSVGAMVFLSVYLRQRGSSESKPVARPHREA